MTRKRATPEEKTARQLSNLEERLRKDILEYGGLRVLRTVAATRQLCEAEGDAGFSKDLVRLVNLCQEIEGTWGERLPMASRGRKKLAEEGYIMFDDGRVMPVPEAEPMPDWLIPARLKR